MKAASVQCPTCGVPLSRKGGSEGLCPSCLLSMALDDTSIEAEVLAESEVDREHLPPGDTFQEGRVLGGRYRFRSLVGRGGMGDVWRAYDLKLRQDVALKALRPELIQNREALEALRKEVRAARRVISPNVCRVYDLEELDGQELVLMEYIDGTTLQEILEERSPLDLVEAREIASQFLAGLEAIHDAGLVHRDIKPENVMMTRTGRVVVMDFGITKGLGDSRSGFVAGTPPYMSPEQARGADLDARSDVFSAGILLAEMVEPHGVKTFEDRQAIWEALHQEGPHVTETPWSRVIRRCATPAPGERFSSAAELARALEEVTLRAVGDEQARPYPGLAAFQEEDADHFYGRELEIESLWKKLRRPHLLALIGPSGAGKSSFLRAGLLPTLIDGWQALVMTPGNRPFDHLARALPVELRDVPSASYLLQHLEDPDVAVELLTEWRRSHTHALLIVDQFEELFTQNTAIVQSSFADVLGRLPLEVDIHVLLSMRDDFLFHCHHFEALRPILTDLTLLGAPTGAALRRALVEPALRCGYGFEDEGIVEQMLGEIEGQRGALPLLAFAAAQLWDRRDRETGLLTRKSYHQIGGVSGALAQHAEATLDYIGEANVPIVREIFRNLVTAEGTRDSRDRQELFSVFDKQGTAGAGSRSAAASVLSTLIDARLLTSFEVPADEEGGGLHHRIEIIHESLLSNWPRLVRWQTQDAEGAQLRDELRSQARIWEEHRRSEDYLWTGNAFKEYELWRERYPGGLTDTEEAFARAMTSFAERRRRQKGIAVTTVITLLLVGLTIVAGFWHRAEQERLRAESGRLLALGELEIDRYPTAALAWATKSLEVFDTEEGRMLALRALQMAPPATVLPANEESRASGLVFSPSGEWLAINGWDRVTVLPEDGKEAITLVNYPNQLYPPAVAFPLDDLVIIEKQGEFRWFSIPEGRELRSAEDSRGQLHAPSGDGYYSVSVDEEVAEIRWWPYEEGESRLIGSMPAWGNAFDIDTNGSRMAYNRQDRVFIRSLDEWMRAPRQVGQHPAEVLELSFHPLGDRVAARDELGELKIWSLEGESTRPLRTLAMGNLKGVVVRSRVGYGPTGRWLGFRGMEQGVASVRLWDLSAPPAAEPLVLRKADEVFSHGVALHPSGRMVVSAYLGNAAFWPLPSRSRSVFHGFEGNAGDLQFSPDGSWLLLSVGRDGLLAWPLEGQNEGKMRVLTDERLRGFTSMAFDPSGRNVAVSSWSTVMIVPLEGGEVREMPAEWPGRGRYGMELDFSPDGRLLASALMNGAAEEMVIRVWDLLTNKVQVLGPVPGSTSFLRFDDNRRLRWVGAAGVVPGATGGERVFDLEDNSVEVVAEEGMVATRALSSNGEFKIDVHWDGDAYSTEDLRSHLAWSSLDGRETRRLDTHPDPFRIALHPSDQWIISGGLDGPLRVGPVSGEEPHLLIGHRGLVRTIAVSPDGRWIASVGDDRTVRVWPFPDMSKPPLHTLPHDELLAELHSRTNVRVVENSDSPTGWKLGYAPFPGWAAIPEWP